VAILRGIRPRKIPGIAAALIGPDFASWKCRSIRRSLWGASRGWRAVMAASAGGRRHGAAGREVEGRSPAGGRLIVMPHATPPCAARKELGMLAIPGFLTPSEALCDDRCGADGLKLFSGRGRLSGGAALAQGGAAEGDSDPAGRRHRCGIDPAWLQAGASFGIRLRLYKPGVDAARDSRAGRS